MSSCCLLTFPLSFSCFPKLFHSFLLFSYTSRLIFFQSPHFIFSFFIKYSLWNHKPFLKYLIHRCCHKTTSFFLLGSFTFPIFSCFQQTYSIFSNGSISPPPPWSLLFQKKTHMKKKKCERCLYTFDED